jgi:DNA-binding MarR family transcriptional regulator
MEQLDGAPLGRLVAMAGHLATERWSRLVYESYRLTAAGAAVLLALGEEGRLTHKELAARCLIRPATLTGVVDTLVRSGHVERLGDPLDRRTVWVQPTRKGASVGAKVRRRVTGEGPRGSERAIRALTSIDADAGHEAIIRRFLIELIVGLADTEEEK